jgi:hypothetical protein
MGVYTVINGNTSVQELYIVHLKIIPGFHEWKKSDDL